MRVTNSMIFGNSMNNLHRNMRFINGLVTKIETEKNIQRPSDDPITAARILRYRTIIEETQQFTRNVQGGLAWMDIAESALMNLTQNALQQLNVRLVEGATGTLTLDDRLGIIEEMRQYIDQIAFEMNQTFMGRYIFSGYRTTQPPVFTTNNDLSFVITQRFDALDFERIKSFQKHLNDPGHNSSAHQGVVHNANVLKLAYNHVNFDFIFPNANGNPLAIPGIQGAVGRNGEPPLRYEIVVRSLMDVDAYTPPGAETENGTAANPFVVHFIQETGELVFSDEAMRTFRDGTTITYQKEGFKKGELNPMIYFDSIEVLGADGRELIPGEIIRQHEDWIVHEIAPGDHQRINDLARHLYTDKMYTDLKRLIAFAESVVISDHRALEVYFKSPPYNMTGQNLIDAIDKQISDETAQANAILHDRFNNMLKLFTRHSENIIAEHARLGTRMDRFDMMGIRLSEDEVHYEELMSGMADTHMPSAIMRKNAAEAALQAAMRAVAMSVQLSLVNFLR
jgi:flagellar hook-associated protein 3 FlgL